MAGSSAATLCEGMPAPPAVMSPPRRAWWHWRDERSNSGGPGCGSRSRRPSFMLKGSKPYDWGGVEPKALGGLPVHPSPPVFHPRSETQRCITARQAHWDVASTDDRRRSCRGIHRRPSPVKRRFFDFKYDAALCCHGKICRSPSEVVMLPEVLPWSADGSPRDVGESGHGEYRHESAQDSESRDESRVGVFGANRSMASRARGAIVESRWSVSVSRAAARTDRTSTGRRATTRQLVTLHGGMGRDVVTPGMIKRFVVSQIKGLADSLQQ
ncbi:hypothetical protein B0T18DRAFT_182930 [Schizothecium vesticola]|uniref:Uncharacterized protein n=1 Tax=Schizothecium vesticola TaxID=314040 RepID=A0AA40EPZ7_9PEZI|nr:hypothetical protein B0T18DRAFT_182930 [Schizothecium vesticola]